MNPLISVVVPIYNVENYLNRCIESIINQTYKNLEIILVDDGSLDNSLNICNEYKKIDKRIQVYTKENGGLSDARNFGIKKCNGDYISFIDSDDFIELSMYEDMVDSIDENVDIVVCDMKYLYDDNSIDFASGGSFKVSSVLENPYLISINNSACNKVFRKSMFDDIEFPKGKYYEDLATVPILLYKAKKIVKIDKPLYIYYQRKNSIAHSVNPKIFDIYDAIDNCLLYVKNHNSNNDIINIVKEFYLTHGLDLATIRIKDFDDKSVRVKYLRENFKLFKFKYPNYKKSDLYKKYSFKKKIIFELLNLKLEKLVLKIYDK